MKTQKVGCFRNSISEPFFRKNFFFFLFFFKKTTNLFCLSIKKKIQAWLELNWLREQQQLNNIVPKSKVDDRTNPEKMVRIQNSRMKTQKLECFCHSVSEPLFREIFFFFLYFFKKSRNVFLFVDSKKTPAQKEFGWDPHFEYFYSF